MSRTPRAAARSSDAAECEEATVADWVAREDGTATPEQLQRLASWEASPEHERHGESLGKALADKMAQLLDRPEAFAEQDRPMIAAVRRAHRHGGWQAVRELRPAYERHGAQGVIRQEALTTSTRRASCPPPPRTGMRPRGAGRPAARAARSSAKSGDSGDSDSSDSDPEPSALPAGPAALQFRSGRTFIADHSAVVGDSVVASGYWEGSSRHVTLGWPRQLIRHAMSLRSGARS